MEYRRKSGGGWGSMALRAALTSFAVVTTAVALRLAGPSVVWFLVAKVPSAYDSALAWLRPPYLYLVINGIIISIAASSHFQKQPSPSAAEPAPRPLHLAVMDPVAVVPAPEYEAKIADEDAPAAEHYAGTKPEAEDEEVEEEFVISRSSWSPKRRRSPLEETRTMQSAAIAEEKPLVSTRFSHRKAAKPSPDSGKALGVARRARRNETLESTWRTITEGRAVPLARHLKKSDTWETRGGGGREEAAAAAVMRKSETFHERGAAASPGSGVSSAGKLRKEASLGQDELNRRVEAFIRKFNEEMRLQRQESLKNYTDMINRGSH